MDYLKTFKKHQRKIYESEGVLEKIAHELEEILQDLVIERYNNVSITRNGNKYNFYKVSVDISTYHGSSTADLNITFWIDDESNLSLNQAQRKELAAIKSNKYFIPYHLMYDKKGNNREITTRLNWEIELEKVISKKINLIFD